MPGLFVTGVGGVLSWVALKIFNPARLIQGELENLRTSTSQAVDRSTTRLCTTGRRITGDTLLTTERIHERSMEELRGAGREASRLTQIGMGAGIVISAVLLANIRANREDRESDPFSSLIQNVADLAIGGLTGVGFFLIYANLQTRQNSLFSGREPLRIPIAPTGIKLRPALSPPNPNDPSYTHLMQAAHEGNCEEIIRLQREGVFLEARDATEKTALHWAAIGKRQKAIDWLWFFGCDLKALDCEHYAPIHFTKDDTKLHAHCARLAKIKNRFDHNSPIYRFYPPENLVFKGGGPKGIAYMGAQEYLEEKGLLRNVRRVVGTSAGAINAMLIALGYTAADIKGILTKTDLKDFLDHPYQTEQGLLNGVASVAKKGQNVTLKECVAMIRDGLSWWYSEDQKGSLSDTFCQMYQKGGVCKGEKFLDWIEDKIFEKTEIPNCTFGEYKKLMKAKNFKHIYLYATQINPLAKDRPTIACFNTEDSQWDDVLLAHAIRASMSIPVIFTPHTLCIKTKEGNIEPARKFGKFLDGGMIRNCPIDRLDVERYKATNSPSDRLFENHQTLAFNLVDPPAGKQAASRAGKTTIAHAVAATASVFRNGEEILLAENTRHRHRIIDIDNRGVGLVSGFFATDEEKADLIASGRRSAKLFDKEQQKLAREHAEHNPANILGILDFCIDPLGGNFDNEEKKQDSLIESFCLSPKSLQALGQPDSSKGTDDEKDKESESESAHSSPQIQGAAAPLPLTALQESAEQLEAKSMREKTASRHTKESVDAKKQSNQERRLALLKKAKQN